MFQAYLNKLESSDLKTYEFVVEHGLRWVIEVHSRSNVRFTAQLEQSSTKPGALMTITATVNEMQIPVGKDRVKVYAEVTTPAGPDTLVLDAVEDGVFVGTYTAKDYGLYTFRTIADGTTLRKEHFTREQLLSGAVYIPGKPNDDGHGGGDEGGKDCDKTIAIFVDTVKGNARLAKSLDTYLRRNGSSLKELLHCLGDRGRSGAAQRHPRGGAAHRGRRAGVPVTLLRCRVTGDAPTLRAFLAETGADVPCRPVAVRDAGGAGLAVQVLLEDTEVAARAQRAGGPGIEVMEDVTAATEAARREVSPGGRYADRAAVPRGLGRKE